MSIVVLYPKKQKNKNEFVCVRVCVLVWFEHHHKNRRQNDLHLLLLSSSLCEDYIIYSTQQHNRIRKQKARHGTRNSRELSFVRSFVRIEKTDRLT